MASQKVSVIITVFNEQANIDLLLSSLQQQTYQPEEIIVVDGGSTDRTFEILQIRMKKWPRLKAFQIPGNRSVGRNYGVSQAAYRIIAFTDAGCIPQKDWLAELIKPFSSPQIIVVSGYYRGLPKNIFEKCLVPYVLVMPDQALKSEFYPSTRSMAIRKSVWDKSGGFDTRLSHNEDYAYAHWLKKLGYNFYFAPSAVVNWIPRKNLSQAAWMFLRFAFGDIESGIFRPRVKSLFFRSFAFSFLFFMAVQIHLLFYPLILLLLAYIFYAIVKNYRYIKDIRAFFWLPVLQITSDLSVLFGSLMGLLIIRSR